MENKTLKEYMTRLSRDKLQKYVGKEILESLIEWQNNDEWIFNKDTLVELIITINGMNIFKEKGFRKDLLKTLEPDQILSFKKNLSKQYEKVEDLNELVEIISEYKWKKSLVTEHLLEILQIDAEEIFKKDEDTEYSMDTIESYEEFYELLDYQYVINVQDL